MHKIVSGVANRSYGIQVAKMAGMPDAVVARAQQVLDGLESHNNNTIRTDTATHARQPDVSNTQKNVGGPQNKVAAPQKQTVQLNLFG